MNRLHWDFINDLLGNNDGIFFGDIWSHDIVKDGKNHQLNRNFNDLKFYRLKQRLVYKASAHGKKVMYVKENYTTKTCSSCGVINDKVGVNRVFKCVSCDLITGRDWNAAKNILMKGLVAQAA